MKTGIYASVQCELNSADIPHKKQNILCSTQFSKLERKYSLSATPKKVNINIS